MIWLVRFLRVLSMIPSLRELTLGIMDALHGLFWVPCRGFTPSIPRNKSGFASGIKRAFPVKIHQESQKPLQVILWSQCYLTLTHIFFYWIWSWFDSGSHLFVHLRVCPSCSANSDGGSPEEVRRWRRTRGHGYVLQCWHLVAQSFQRLEGMPES